MSAIEGKMLTCDMCGKSVFLRYLGDCEADGGFTRWRKYEKAEGWASFHVPNVHLGDVCPDCNEKLQNALLKCINGEMDGV